MKDFKFNKECFIKIKITNYGISYVYISLNRIIFYLILSIRIIYFWMENTKNIIIILYKKLWQISKHKISKRDFLRSL